MFYFTFTAYTCVGDCVKWLCFKPSSTPSAHKRKREQALSKRKKTHTVVMKKSNNLVLQKIVCVNKHTKRFKWLVLKEENTQNTQVVFSPHKSAEKDKDDGSMTLRQTCSRDLPESARCVRRFDDSRFCNSHYVSQLAAFFIDARAKRSTVKSCNLIIRHCKLSKDFYKPRTFMYAVIFKDNPTSP